MAFYEERTVKCKCCGNYFSVDCCKFLRVPEDNSLKEKLLSSTLSKFTCPSCGKSRHVINRLVYVDDDKKVVIMGDVFDSYLGNKEELHNDFPGYSIYYVFDMNQLLDTINIIDNGLDPNTCEYLKYIYELRVKDIIKRKNFQAEVVGSYFEVSDDDTMKVSVSLKTEKCYKKKEIEISPESYNKAFDLASNIYSLGDKAILSTKYILKLKLLSLSKDIEEIKEHKYELLFITNFDTSELELLFVQSFNDGVFNVNDKVVAAYYDENNDCTLHRGVVEKVISITDLEFPYELNELAVATLKIKDWNFESEPNSTRLNNAKILDSLKLHKFNDDIFKALFESNMILPMQLDDSDSPDDGPQVKLVFDSDKIYLAVYTNKKAIKDKNILVKPIYKFTDILNIFFSYGSLDGIIFNPETDKVIYSVNRLFNLLTDRIMTNKELFMDYLSNITDKEIEFIGKEKYDIICKVYFDEKKPKQIMEDDNLTKEKVDYYLDDGYYRIIQILRSKLLI